MAMVVNMLVHKKCMGCGCRCRHRDMDTSTGTWMVADWKHEHMNLVKKVKTTHQTHCRGRQAGVATTGVARCDWV